MNNLREIWRGKRINNIEHNGEWVEGVLYPVKYTGSTIPGGTDYYIIAYPSGGGRAQIQVDPATLGKCIGRCDKNNKPIFENDIVKTKYGRLCLVVWFQSPQFIGFDLKPLEDKNPAPTKYDLFDCLEVIGNKFDNPELLQPNKT